MTTEVRFIGLASVILIPRVLWQSLRAPNLQVPPELNASLLWCSPETWIPTPCMPVLDGYFNDPALTGWTKRAYRNNCVFKPRRGLTAFKMTWDRKVDSHTVCFLFSWGWWWLTRRKKSCFRFARPYKPPRCRLEGSGCTKTSGHCTATDMSQLYWRPVLAWSTNV